MTVNLKKNSIVISYLIKSYCRMLIYFYRHINWVQCLTLRLDIESRQQNITFISSCIIGSLPLCHAFAGEFGHTIDIRWKQNATHLHHSTSQLGRGGCRFAFGRQWHSPISRLRMCIPLPLAAPLPANVRDSSPLASVDLIDDAASRYVHLLYPPSSPNATTNVSNHDGHGPSQYQSQRGC